MKRTAISGLFLASTLLASPVFAAEDLCASNLQKINDNMPAAQVSNSESLDDSLEVRLEKAKAAQATGDTKECVAITSKIISRMEKTEKGGQ
ncbi:hypothetical protein [Pseudomonas fontis]|uniref:Secreted protein n=1 Tax=Pseudomonas fontis TaxID=2942633 RepID=A0ABT5NN42_9PSED|nr:hypothetical protein [Pseudomonas fontis]MDD0973295.1 hypothetical protein [Pseudomonas fontis]MDD0989573.1 hypothetical protein [Pseudomonas fontis]